MSHNGKKNAELKPNHMQFCYFRALGFLLEIIKEKENGENVHMMDKWWSCEIRCAQLLGTPQNQSEVEIAWEAMFNVNYH